MNQQVIVEPRREFEIAAETPGSAAVEIARTPNLDPPGAPEALFAQNEVGEFRSRWDQIQTDFVDDPRGSVEKADHLVAGTIKRVAEVFADQRTRLENEWAKGDSVSTEDLRQALRRYRSFFDRLLSAGADAR